jgi:hypothetical protein
MIEQLDVRVELVDVVPSGRILDPCCRLFDTAKLTSRGGLPHTVGDARDSQAIASNRVVRQMRQLPSNLIDQRSKVFLKLWGMQWYLGIHTGASNLADGDLDPHQKI